MSRSFRELMTHSIYDDATWKLVESLFQQHYPNTTGSPSIIPKRIHQIWLGSQIPRKYDRLRQTWIQQHPSWEYRLWTSADVADFELRNANIFKKAGNPGAQSDIFRYEILYRLGGIYVDTDFECLQPFDDLLYLDFFTGTGHNQLPIWFNGLIASAQYHPIVESLVNQSKQPSGGWDGTASATGPYFFTDVVTKHLQRDAGRALIFPTAFFYPFPATLRECTVSDDADSRALVRSHLSPESKCVHLWYASWQ